MADKFLDRAYDKATPEEARVLYDAWAQTYEAEIAENGYVTPGRVAAAMAKHVKDKTAPLLDFGCGTGLSGLALQLQGFTTIDGMDPAGDMLKIAQAKQAYRTLTQISTSDATPISQGSYPAIAAIGVIGAAPASTFDLLMRALPKGGMLGFSLNDHALADHSYEGAMSQWLDCGAARLLFKEYGPHLPGKNIKSNVYIIEKS